MARRSLIANNSETELKLQFVHSWFSSCVVVSNRVSNFLSSVAEYLMYTVRITFRLNEFVRLMHIKIRSLFITHCEATGATSTKHILQTIVDQSIEFSTASAVLYTASRDLFKRVISATSARRWPVLSASHRAIRNSLRINIIYRRWISGTLHLSPSINLLYAEYRITCQLRYTWKLLYTIALPEPQFYL